MQISLTKVSDTLTPDLRRLYKNASDKSGIHSAMGLAIVGITKRAFNDASLRPRSWSPKSDGSPARLRKSGTLAKSIRVTASGASGFTVGTDRPYGAIHQLGGQTAAHTILPKNGQALNWPGAAHPVAKVEHPGSKIPARPYLPFSRSGQPTRRAVQELQRVALAKLSAGR